MSRPFPLFILGSVLACAFAAPAHAAWSSSPLVVSATTQPIPRVGACSDGAGGAFVAWSEQGQIRLQHVLASGEVDPGWAPAGIVTCDVVATRSEVQAIPDGLGGAIVWWMEGGAAYLKRVGPDGQTADGWPARGRHLANMIYQNVRPELIPDGAGGVFAAWVGTSLDPDDPVAAYVIHIAPNNAVGGGLGSVRNVSGADEVVTYEYAPQLLSSGDGGVYVAWASASTDEQTVPNAWRLTRLTTAGLPASGWPVGGIAIRALNHYDPMSWSRLDIAADGDGGLYYFLVDQVEPGNGYTLDGRVLRLDPDGAAAAGWPAAGVGVTDMYVSSDVGPDGSVHVFPGLGATAIVGVPQYSVHWPSYLSGIASATNPAWPGGVSASVAGTEMISNGAGGVFAAGLKPTGPTGPYQPCAFLRMAFLSPAGGWTGVDEVHCEVVLNWYGDLALAPTGDGGAIFFWSQERERVGLFARRFSGTGEVVSVPTPIPAPGSIRAWFATGSGVRVVGAEGDAGPHRIDLFDAGGRRVSEGRIEGGRFDLVLPGTARMAAGLYFVRVRSDAGVRSARVVVQR